MKNSIKLTILIISFLSILSFPLKSQISSIDLSGSFSSAGSFKYAVTKASGFGGGIDVSVKVFNDFYIIVNTGYQSYSIDQDSALTQWKWNFWDNRYYGSIRADLTDTAKYSLVITPNQGINSVPLALKIGYETRIGGLSVRPYVGAGILFFSRWFFVEENWTKKLSKLDNTFNYSYRNFAPSKQGNPIMLLGGLSLTYPLIDYISVKGEFNYTYFVETEGMGYSELPFSDNLNFKLGLSFSY